MVLKICKTSCLDKKYISTYTTLSRYREVHIYYTFMIYIYNQFIIINKKRDFHHVCLYILLNLLFQQFIMICENEFYFEHYYNLQIYTQISNAYLLLY